MASCVRCCADDVAPVQEVTGEEEPGEAPKAALGGLFGRAKKAAQDTAGEADADKKPGKALGGLFGRTKRAAEKAIDEIESEPKPKPFAGLLGGTRKVRDPGCLAHVPCHHNVNQLLAAVIYISSERSIHNSSQDVQVHDALPLN